MTLSYLWPGFQGHDILEAEYRETARLKDKVTIAQEESVPNIWNGTMLGDLDWPLKASRAFVSISWVAWSSKYDTTVLTWFVTSM